MLVQHLCSRCLVLFLDPTSKFQHFSFLLFVFNFKIVSPGRIDLAVFNLSTQEFKHLNLVILEFLSIEKHAFGYFRSLPFFRFVSFSERLPSCNHKLHKIFMCPNSSKIDLPFGFREQTLSHKLWVLFVVSDEGEEVIDVVDLTEMRANGIKEYQLQVYVSLNEVYSGFMAVAVNKIHIFHCRKIMEAILHHISVYHLFICISNFIYLLLHLVLKYLVEESHTLYITHTFSV